jgi:hypothetical protein
MDLNPGALIIVLLFESLVKTTNKALLRELFNGFMQVMASCLTPCA